MSDNIFNYFSNKGTRKVDPIDDAEFDSIDAPPPQSDPPSQQTMQGNVADLNQPQVDADFASTDQGSGSSRGAEPMSNPSSEKKTTEPQAKKPQSHWDYLASLLGIKKEATPDSSPEVRTDRTTEKAITVPSQKQDKSQVTSHREPAKPLSTARNELAPIEPAKDEAILSSLFLAGETPVSNSAVSKPSENLQSSDDDSEYVEFEVEDLNKSDEGDDSDRKPRRSFSRPNENRSRDDQSRRGGNRDRNAGRQRQDAQSGSENPRAPSDSDSPSRGRQGREAQGRQGNEQPSRAPQSRDNQGRNRQGRDDRPNREEVSSSGHPRRDHGPGSENNSRRENRPERDSSRRAPVDAPTADSFGSGIFDESAERNEVRSEESAPRRRRRRRGGRDSSSKESPPSNLPRQNPLPEFDPPDEFFDEVGWQPSQPSRQHRPVASDRLPGDEFESHDSADSEFPAAEQGETEQGERTGRRRRRRRPRTRRESTDLTNPATDSNFENRTSPSRDRLDEDKDEFDYDQVHRNPKQHRPSTTSGRNHDDEIGSMDENPKKDRKFPTWEEAISTLVESNIKNHSRSGQNRSGNRGRRRR